MCSAKVSKSYPWGVQTHPEDIPEAPGGVLWGARGRLREACARNRKGLGGLGPLQNTESKFCMFLGGYMLIFTTSSDVDFADFEGIQSSL